MHRLNCGCIPMIPLPSQPSIRDAVSPRALSRHSSRVARILCHPFLNPAVHTLPVVVDILMPIVSISMNIVLPASTKYCSTLVLYSVLCSVTSCCACAACTAVPFPERHFHNRECKGEKWKSRGEHFSLSASNVSTRSGYLMAAKRHPFDLPPLPSVGLQTGTSRRAGQLLNLSQSVSLALLFLFVYSCSVYL
jgi:hypothetical protein